MKKLFCITICLVLSIQLIQLKSQDDTGSVEVTNAAIKLEFGLHSMLWGMEREFYVIECKQNIVAISTGGTDGDIIIPMNRVNIAITRSYGDEYEVSLTCMESDNCMTRIIYYTNGTEREFDTNKYTFPRKSKDVAQQTYNALRKMQDMLLKHFPN